MLQALLTPFGKGRGSGGGAVMEGAGERVGDGAGDLEAPSGPGIRTFPLPQVSRTRKANGGDQISEAGADGSQS